MHGRGYFEISIESGLGAALEAQNRQARARVEKIRDVLLDFDHFRGTFRISISTHTATHYDNFASPTVFVQRQSPS